MKRLLLFFLSLAVVLSATAFAEDGAAPTASASPEATAAAAAARQKGQTAPKTQGKASKQAKSAEKSAETPEKSAETPEKSAEMAENSEKLPENAPKTVENAVETAEMAEKTAVSAAPAPVGPRRPAPAAASTRLVPASARASLEQLFRRDGVLLDSYAAVVGKKIITVGDVFALAQPRIQQLAATRERREVIARRAQEIFEEARDALIADELVLLAFADAGGTLPDRAIEDHISDVLNTRFGGDREKLFSALAAARLSMDDWRKKMTDQLAVQVMRQKEISARVLVTPGDIRADYERDQAKYTHPARVHIRMLSIPRGTTSEEVSSSRRLAQRIRERILSGVADFPKAARLLSHATGAGENAGDAGWHDTADLVPGVAEAVEQLAPGGISPVLEVPPFFYLVQLEERQDASVDAFGEVADEIESKLKAAQYEKLEKAWLDTLKGKYFVQTYRHELF